MLHLRQINIAWRGKRGRLGVGSGKILYRPAMVYCGDGQHLCFPTLHVAVSCFQRLRWCNHLRACYGTRRTV